MMNQKDLLKKLLPGLLPILVFIAVESFFGSKMGVLVAVVFGALQLLVIRLKEKRFDKFVLLDTLLLLMLGGISIIFDNDLFFKIKPAVIGSLITILLGVSAFGRHNLVLKMSQRYVKDMPINEAQESVMLSGIKLMFWLFLFHTALVFYAAFFLSNAAWAFISGALFYIIAGVAVLVMFVVQRLKIRKMKRTEWLPIVDMSGKCLGRESRETCHSEPGHLHPVVHLHVFNGKGEILLQKRPAHKRVQPNMWDTAVGGHVAFGEQLDKALFRESREEIGIVPEKLVGLSEPYLWESDVESELVYSYLVYNEGPFFPEIPEETDELRFFSPEEIKRMIESGHLTPNFVHEWTQLEPAVEVLSKIAN